MKTIWVSLSILVLVLVLSVSSVSSVSKNHCSFPKIIFQTWKSKIDIPDNMRYWMQTWINNNKDYNHILWDDDDNRNFIEKYYPWFLEIYDSYERNICRADAVRYFFLYHYGGIYADMDFECLKPMESLLKTYSDYSILLGKMTSDNTYNTHDVPNAIMISKPRQDFWIVVFYFLIQNQHEKLVEEATGPIMLKKALAFYESNKNNLTLFDWYNNIAANIAPNIAANIAPNIAPNIAHVAKIKIFNPEIFYPISWITNSKKRLNSLDRNDFSQLTNDIKKDYPNSYAVTYWTHSW